MEILAFDEQRKLVAVDLSPAVIAANLIEPWRLDLMDSNAVQLEVDGKLLFFTHLRGLSFGYEENGLVTIGFYDGDTAIACSGTTLEDTASAKHDESPVKIEHSQLIRREFAEVFERFLSMEPDQTLGLCRGVYLGPQYCNGVFSWEPDDFWGVIHESEMDQEIKLSVELPPAITWVFEEFGQDTVEVVGDCVKRALLNEPVEEVEIISSGDWTDGFIQRMKGMGAQECKQHEAKASVHSLSSFNQPDCFQFIVNGIQYRISRLFHEHLPQGSKLSTDDIYAGGPNEVTASRIALFDLSNGRTRTIESNLAREMRYPRGWNKHLVLIPEIIHYDFDIHDRLPRTTHYSIGANYSHWKGATSSSPIDLDAVLQANPIVTSLHDFGSML